MAAEPVLRVENLGQFQRDLDAVADAITNLHGADARAAEVVRAETEARAPRRSGTLARSYRVQTQQRGGAYVETELVYAPVLERGWPAHGIAAQPHLSPALDAMASEVRDVYRRELASVINRHFPRSRV